MGVGWKRAPRFPGMPAGEQGRTSLEELIELYLNDTNARLAELRTALNEQDARVAQLIVHSVKGSSGNLGIRRLTILCAEFEEQLHNHELTGARVILEQLEDEFVRVQGDLAGQLQPV